MTYETFFSDGGHSGPHGSKEAAIEYATAYIRGSEPTMWVAIVPTTVSLDFDRSKVLNASHRQKLGVTLVKRAKKNPSRLESQQKLEDFYRSVERKLIQRPTEVTFSAKHIYMWFSERFSGGWHIDFEANVRTDGRRTWLDIQGERKKYTNPAQAAKAINERRDLEIELNDPEGFRDSADAKKNPSGRWIQKVDKRIEKRGTEGAFTKQAKRAGYNDPMEYAAKIMAAWRSGRKRVYNRKTKRDQKISLQLMRRANFALNVQSRRR